MLKGPPPSFQGIPPIWSAGLFQKASSPTATCVQTSSHRLERPTILQYSDFQNVVARVHRRRKLLESQKGDTTRIHRRRKLFESTEGGMHPNPQKEEDAQDHRRRKVLDHTKGGSHTSQQMRSLKLDKSWHEQEQLSQHWHTLLQLITNCFHVGVTMTHDCTIAKSPRKLIWS